MEFPACCRTTAEQYLRRHRDVATCDGCGRLLLAYGNTQDFDETSRALVEQGIPFATERRGALRIIAKPRTGARTPRGGPAKPA